MHSVLFWQINKGVLGEEFWFPLNGVDWMSLEILKHNSPLRYCLPNWSMNITPTIFSDQSIEVSEIWFQLKGNMVCL